MKISGKVIKRDLMSSLQIVEHFWKLCDAAHQFEVKNIDVPSLEPYLLEILLFVKENSEYTDLLKTLFVKLATKRQYDSNWVVLYCMRELKYLDVKNAVNKQFENLGGTTKVPRLMNFVSDINHVYEDAIWEDADFFKYHWEREHPGEPWPCEKI